MIWALLAEICHKKPFANINLYLLNIAMISFRLNLIRTGSGCGKRFKTIKDVKNHVDEMQYDDGWHYVYH